MVHSTEEDMPKVQAIAWKGLEHLLIEVSVRSPEKPTSKGDCIFSLALDCKEN